MSMCTHSTETLKKCLKYKFLEIKGIVWHEIFPEGASPLCAGVTP